MDRIVFFAEPRQGGDQRNKYSSTQFIHRIDTALSLVYSFPAIVDGLDSITLSFSREDLIPFVDVSSQECMFASCILSLWP